MKDTKKQSTTEILAPAGNMESLVAAVRCGADAVYLGGTLFSARQGAGNFDEKQLVEAAKYAHAREVQVHLALNTVVFSDELEKAEKAIKIAAKAGVDAFIIQDLAVLDMAKKCTRGIQFHASTQMAVHNLNGVMELAQLGFSRAVLARELTYKEIQTICSHSPIDIEIFVHGALCMSVSGQCYLSSMIGGRSGNRGRCAQPCRLPFATDESTHALSLRDLSVIERIPELSEIGVSSFKIEGRLKRPEYVAAAVTACRQVLKGESPDYETLQAVFSRSGFTDGYIADQMGEEMFGTRRREDVVSVEGKLKELAGLYHQESPRVPVSFHLEITKDTPSKLTASSGSAVVTVEGMVPETARTAPTNGEKAKSSLEKTGKTPFYLLDFTYQIDDGLMLPVSSLNALRRESLDKLLGILEEASPKEFTEYNWKSYTMKSAVEKQKIRCRFQYASQISAKMLEYADEIILPLNEVESLDNGVLSKHLGKIILELPRVMFAESTQNRVTLLLDRAREKGVTRLIAGDLGGINLSKSKGFAVAGDFPLNIVNPIAEEKYKELGLDSITMSAEYSVNSSEPDSGILKGIIAYGYLPLMIFRNHPAGLKKPEGELVDRLGNKFSVKKQGDVSALYNCVPIFWGDKVSRLNKFDFITLYFTQESQNECDEIADIYKKGEKYLKPFTRGLYNRRVE